MWRTYFLQDNVFFFGGSLRREGAKTVLRLCEKVVAFGSSVRAQVLFCSLNGGI
jgi:hypothetical protein